MYKYPPKTLGTAPFKISQMRGNALLEKVSNIFGQISRTIFWKSGESGPPLSTSLPKLLDHDKPLPITKEHALSGGSVKKITILISEGLEIRNIVCYRLRFLHAIQGTVNFTSYIQPIWILQLLPFVPH